MTIWIWVWGRVIDGEHTCVRIIAVETGVGRAATSRNPTISLHVTHFVTQTDRQTDRQTD